ncbi:hypothetical protein K469DRAFT_176021 [Zopfia rhizophila CBS 207.26]|uniref:Uncharacterized protein n=1 Tax=Zopfia rhizophila CBS 207.26 TaxID=1314779 RepID=A0A6A6DY90_9PEZI|nr:hypothetical protein K469DRAFT_176021 [Zopfia rhizophila CBS 207.26]
MSVDTFKDAQKEYNIGEESCRVSLEGRLRQDTFKALQVLNAETGREQDVPKIVQGNAGGKQSQDNDVQELVNNFRQYDRRDQLNVAAVHSGIRTSADIFEVTQREHDNNRRARGSGVRRARRQRGRSAFVGVFKVWSSGLEEEIVDGAEANIDQRESNENVAKVLNRINERSRQYMMRSLGIMASADIFEAAQKEYEETRGGGILRGIELL